MRHFKWIDWNRQKVRDHGVSPEEVEQSFDRIVSTETRSDGSVRVLNELPSGKFLWVIWRYDEEEEIPDVFGESDDHPVFVITAFFP